MSEKITQTILKTIKILTNNEITDTKTRLFGSNDAIFDSVGLVGFLIELEEQIYADFGKNITLADAKAMSRATSPFINVSTLAKYIKSCLDE